MAVVMLFVLFLWFGIALLAPIISPHNPYEITEDSFAPPSAEHPLGTDYVGRDMFSRVLYGARTSLLVGIVAVGTTTTIGIAIGMFSGFFAGKIDDVLMRLTDMFQVIPKFFLALVMVSAFEPSILNVALVIGVLSWPSTARLVRADFLSIREQAYVEAAKSIGVSDIRIMINEILPNCMTAIIVNASFQMGSAILVEAGLSFLGLGDPSALSWGGLLYDSVPFFRTAWWLPVFPGLAISIAVLSLNLVGEGLNEALNPRFRER
jgi:peptide/nickel transport system permease protein